MTSVSTAGWWLVCLTCLSASCDVSFDGRVVARLPFEPISFIRGLSHRNLVGDDYRQCSFIFLYILCTMSIRQVRPALPSKGRKVYVVCKLKVTYAFLPLDSRAQLQTTAVHSTAGFCSSFKEGHNFIPLKT